MVKNLETNNCKSWHLSPWNYDNYQLGHHGHHMCYMGHILALRDQVLEIQQWHYQWSLFWNTSTKITTDVNIFMDLDFYLFLVLENWTLSCKQYTEVTICFLEIKVPWQFTFSSFAFFFFQLIVRRTCHGWICFGSSSFMLDIPQSQFSVLNFFLILFKFWALSVDT